MSSNDWFEVSVKVDGEGAESVADALRRYVHQGIAIENALPGEAWEDDDLPVDNLIVRGYFPDDSQASETKRRIEEALYYLGRLYPIPAPEFQTISEDDWANAWKKHYKPIRVGKRILITPAWIDVEAKPDDILIAMDPGMAFGTGTHPTTQLCLQAVECFAQPGTCMVDIGSGSGVLAIAAAKLGCHSVLGLEIDETAVKVSRENVKRNGVADAVTIVHGSVDSLTTTDRKFDWAVANVTANIIHKLIPMGLQHVVWPRGKIVFSGIIYDQVDDVLEALDTIGIELLDKRQMGDWVMLITQRQAVD